MGNESRESRSVTEAKAAASRKPEYRQESGRREILKGDI